MAKTLGACVRHYAHRLNVMDVKKKQRQTNVQSLIADSVLDERVLSSPGVTSWDLDVFGLCV